MNLAVFLCAVVLFISTCECKTLVGKDLLKGNGNDESLQEITKAKIPKGRNGNCPGHDLHGSCCDCGNNDIVRGTCNGFKADGTCCPANQTIDECCICGKTNFTTNTYHCYPQRSDGQCCHDHEWYVDLIDLLVRFDCCECGTHDDNFHRQRCNPKDGAGNCCLAYYEDGTCCPSGQLYNCRL